MEDKDSESLQRKIRLTQHVNFIIEFIGLFLVCIVTFTLLIHLCCKSGQFGQLPLRARISLICFAIYSLSVTVGSCVSLFLDDDLSPIDGSIAYAYSVTKTF